jgi:hypothetical protein
VDATTKKIACLKPLSRRGAALASIHRVSSAIAAAVRVG